MNVWFHALLFRLPSLGQTKNGYCKYNGYGGQDGIDCSIAAIGRADALNHFTTLEVIKKYKYSPYFYIEYFTQNVIFYVKSHVTNMGFEDY